jgi:multimeric flavodoxin WrbA
MDEIELMKVPALIEITSPEPRILCIGGSPRVNGNSDVVLKTIVKTVHRDIETEIIQLRDYCFQSCIGCERCRKDKYCSGLNDGMHLIYPKLIHSQGLVLVSPTHNYNITALMKAFIDRLYCFYDFDNKCPRGWSSRLADQKRKAAIVAICEQADKKDMGFTLEAMRLPLKALGYEIIDELAIFKVFERGVVKKEGNVMANVSEIGENLVRSLQR